MCGEKGGPVSRLFLRRGSPPRVRGEGTVGALRRDRAGITPACAGRSDTHNGSKKAGKDHPRVCGEKSTGCAIRAPSADHPRVCGEKAENLINAVPDAGSPPRVRGEVAIIMSVAKTRGITPACAGRSAVGAFGDETIWDHPRVCGEKHPAT